MSVTMPYKKLRNICDQLYLASRHYINTILKILLVMLTLKPIGIINACDTDT